MEFNKENFKSEVEENKGLVLIDFFASWCGPCKLMHPVVDALIEEYKDKSIKIGKVDIDKSPDLAEQYEVMGVPTFIFLKEGKIIDRFSGYKSKEEVRDLINKHLGNDLSPE